MEEGKNLGLFNDSPSGQDPTEPSTSSEADNLSEIRQNNENPEFNHPKNKEVEINADNSAVNVEGKNSPEAVPTENPMPEEERADNQMVNTGNPEANEPESGAADANSNTPTDSAGSLQNQASLSENGVNRETSESAGPNTNFFEGEPKNEENRPNYPIDDGSNEVPRAKSGDGWGSFIRIIVIVIVIGLAVWYLSLGHKTTESSGSDIGNLNVVVDPNKQKGNVIIIGEDELGNIKGNSGQFLEQNADLAVSLAASTVKIKAFYVKTSDADCSHVYALERVTEKKYDSEVINTIRGLIAPLSEAEKAQGFVSYIPAGTGLGFVEINGNVALVNFNDKLGTVSGVCATTAVKTQITQTVKQFSYIKEVVICINGNCLQDQILQP